MNAAILAPVRRAPITLIFAALSAWLMIVNYGVDLDLIGGDPAAFWAMPRELFSELRGFYYNGPGLGTNASLALPGLFPLLTVSAALASLGLGTPAVARIVLGTMFFLTFLGQFRLSFRLLRDHVRVPVATIASLCAALVYGINPFTIWAYSTPAQDLTICTVALPWAMYAVLYGAERSERRGLFALAATIFLGGGCGTNPARFAVLLLAVGVAAAIALAEGRPTARVARVAGLGSMIGVVSCAWWIAPLPSIVSTGVTSLSDLGVGGWLHWMSERSSFARLFKLDGFLGALQLQASAWYASPAGDLFGYLPLLIGVVGFGRIRARAASILLIAFLADLFLAKGVHEPFGNVYGYLIDHVPGFSIFRSPYDKWIPLGAACFCSLFSLGLGGIALLLERLPNVHRRSRAVAAVGALGLVAAVVYPLPIYAGHILNLLPGTKETYLNVLPRSYHTMAGFVKQSDPGVRTVVFNSGAPPFAVYTWGFSGTDPLLRLTDHPLTSFDDVVPDAVDASTAQLSAMFRDLNVKYVVVHHDLVNPLASPHALPSVLASRAHRLLSTKELDLYALDAQPMPMARLVTDPVVLARPQARDLARTLVGSTGITQNATFFLPSAIRDWTIVSGAAPPGLSRLVPGLLGDRAHRSLFVPRAAQLRYVTSSTCRREPALAFAVPAAWRFGGRALFAAPVRLCTHGTSDAVTLPSADGRDERRIGGGAFDASLYAQPANVEYDARIATLAPAARANPFGGATAIVGYLAARPVTVVSVASSGMSTSRFASLARRLTAFSAEDGSRSLKTLELGHSAVRFQFAAPTRALWLSGFSSLPPGVSVRAEVHVIQTAQLDLLGPSATLVDPAASLVQPPAHSMRVDAAAARSTLASILGLQDGTNVTGDAKPHVLDRWASALPANDAQERTSGHSGDTFEFASRGSFDWYAAALVDPAEMYRFSARYRATQPASLTIVLDGVTPTAPIALVADGRDHDVAVDLAPSKRTAGAFKIDLTGTSASTVALRAPTLRAIGPNGTFARFEPGPARLTGSLVSAQRTHPWSFDVTLDGCHPCALRLDVSDAKNWSFTHGAVLARLNGPGKPDPPLDAYSPGSAVFLLDTGSGRASTTVYFRPAALFAIGACIAVPAIAVMLVGGLFAWRKDRGLQAAPAAAKALPPWSAAAVSLLLACSAVTADLQPEMMSLVFASIAFACMALIAVWGLLPGRKPATRPVILRAESRSRL